MPIDESTRAMSMCLDGISLAPPDIEIGLLAWEKYLEYLSAVGGALRPAQRGRSERVSPSRGAT